MEKNWYANGLTAEQNEGMYAQRVELSEKEPFLEFFWNADHSSLF